jgi:hypothetical protein
MKWPPYLLKLRFHDPDHGLVLWLPLFLLWPVALVFLLLVFLILLPFAFLAVIFTWRPDWMSILLGSIPAIYRLFSHLPGLVVNVDDNKDQVYIEFI